MGVGLGRGQKRTEGTSSATRQPPAEFGAGVIVQVVELIRAVQVRSADYSWPPIARALADGRVPEPTHRGRRMLLLHRRESQAQAPIDVRAVEVELARRAELFEPAPPPEEDKPKGMTIAEAARFIGVYRGMLAKALVEVPPGPVPPLPPGKIPCRLVGRTRRIFKEDLLGAQRAQGEHQYGSDTQREAPGPARTGGTAWDRQIADIFES